MLYARCTALRALGRGGALLARGLAVAPRAPPTALEGTVARTFARTGVLVIAARVGVDVPAGSAVRAANGEEGIVIGQHMHLVFAASTGVGTRAVEGEAVRMDASARSLGNAAAALRIGGAPLPLDADALAAATLFAEPVTQAALARISRPLLTGLTTIDALTPLGYGQSMVFVGPVGSGKRALLARILSAQRPTDAVCVFADTRGADAGAMDVAGEVAAAGAALTTVSPPAGAATPAMGALAAAAAIALGGAARAAGRDAIVAIDSLSSSLAPVWDDCASALRELLPPPPPGAGLSDDALVRQFVARFVQQSAPLRSGGSLSLLMTVDTEQAAAAATGGGGGQGATPPPREGAHDAAHADPIVDVAALPPGALTAAERARVAALVARGVSPTRSVLLKIGIRPRLGRGGEGEPAPAAAALAPPRASVRARLAEQCMSLGDGHITLDASLAARGVAPPVAPQASLSRIGAGTELVTSGAPALLAVSSGLRFEMVNGADSRSDEGRAVRAARAGGAAAAVDELGARRAAAFRAALRQPAGSAPRSLAESTALLHAVAAGLLDPLRGAAGASAAANSWRQVEPEALARLLALARGAAPEAIARLDASPSAPALDAAEIGALRAAWAADAQLRTLLGGHGH